MKSYTNVPDAISDLHQNGFTHDFQLFGNDLLWVQEGFFIRAGEFTILECHKIACVGDSSKDEISIFAISAPYHHAKGILLNHSKNLSAGTPPVLVKKLNELKHNYQS